MGSEVRYEDTFVEPCSSIPPFPGRFRTFNEYFRQGLEYYHIMVSDVCMPCLQTGSHYQAVPIGHVLTKLFQAIYDGIGNFFMVRGGLQPLIIL